MPKKIIFYSLLQFKLTRNGLVEGIQFEDSWIFYRHSATQLERLLWPSPLMLQKKKHDGAENICPSGRGFFNSHQENVAGRRQQQETDVNSPAR